MKNFCLLAIGVTFCLGSRAQNVAIGTPTPHVSAKLDITSNSSGLLIPRMTSAQRTAIASPAQGLMVYDTNTNTFWFYNASAWINLSLSVSSGAWSLTGNAGTNPATNFVGTTDNKPIRFRINNSNAGELDSVSTKTFFGYGSGQKITTGRYNVGIGYKALSSNQTGENNTALGYATLFFNTGSNNTAIGEQSLYFNSTGHDNTANGMLSLYYNATGSFNTANGFQALYNNVDANNNTATGYHSLFNNTTGTSNTANGMYGLYLNTTGHQNTAHGFAALYGNADGSYNTATGAGALNNSKGSWNTADGAYAMYQNSTGNYNTAQGYEALYSNTTGNTNTAIGSFALYSNTTGYENVAVGSGSLYDNTTGFRNVALGRGALSENTTGRDNIAIGISAMSDNSTGSFNTAIGWDIQNYNDYDFSVGLGFRANITASNVVRLGSTGDINGSDPVSIGGKVGWTTLSDGRVKKNIKSNVPGLAFITRLKPITYTIDEHLINAIILPSAMSNNVDRDDQLLNRDNAAPINAAKVYSGFSAQDVEKTAKSLHFDFSGVDPAKNEKDLYGLRYGEFVVPLVKAVQEQQVMIEELKKVNMTLQKENEEFKTRLEKLEKILISTTQ